MSDEGENGPFQCSFTGCNQNFSNIDRLNVHATNHSKDEAPNAAAEDLRIKMTRSEQMIDQTPTPTRFLRVCDDEGLFQDMSKSANPFDEGFQAGLQKTGQESNSQFSGVETLAAVAVASAAASPSHSDDELRPSEAAANGSIASSTASSTSSTQSMNQTHRLGGPFMNGDVVVPVPPPASVANRESSIPMAIPPASFLPKGASTSGVPSSVRSTPKPPVAPDTKKTTIVPPSIETLPVASSVSLKTEEEEDMDTHTVMIAVDASSDGGSSTDNTPKSTPNANKRRRAAEDLDPAEKRARFLQRNREAATRCREKRKEWIATLERRSQELARQNAQLQAEVNALRNERAHLKVLLLSHKDCPVTVQQQKQLQIPASLLPQNAVQMAVQQTSSTSSASDGETSEGAETSTSSTAAAAAAGGAQVSQAQSMAMPSLVMPVSSTGAGNLGAVEAVSSPGGQQKGTVTLALPTPINLAGGAGQNVASPLTPLLMFPLTSDHLQMAAAASSAPTLDFNSLQILQQLQQQSQRPLQPQSTENSPSKAAGTVAAGAPATPSTAAIQALLGSAQLAVLQAAIQQQAQLQLQLQPVAAGGNPGDASGAQAAAPSTVPGAPVVEDIQEVEL